jgi:hypothetical protein
MKKIFSFDAETNGLWGEAFSISAVVEENGEQKSITYRCPIKGYVNDFVLKNVIPAMEDIKETHRDYYSMLKSFMEFYMENKEDADVIVHMGLPVEARLFLDARKLGYIGDWDAPYPLIDVSAFKEIGTSVDTYVKNNKICVPKNIGTHNPLYDCISALEAYKNIIK